MRVKERRTREFALARVPGLSTGAGAFIRVHNNVVEARSCFVVGGRVVVVVAEVVLLIMEEQRGKRVWVVSGQRLPFFLFFSPLFFYLSLQYY